MLFSFFQPPKKSFQKDLSIFIFKITQICKDSMRVFINFTNQIRKMESESNLSHIREKERRTFVWTSDFDEFQFKDSIFKN